MNENARSSIKRGALVGAILYFVCGPIRGILDLSLEIDLVIDILFISFSVIAALVCYFNSSIKEEIRYFCYGLPLVIVPLAVISLIFFVIILNSTS